MRWAAKSLRQPRRDAEGTALPRMLVFLYAWIAVATLSYTRYYLQDPRNALWPGILFWWGCFFPWVVLSPLVFRMENRFQLTRSRLLGSFAALAAASLAFSYLAYLLSVAFGVSILTLLHRPFSPANPVWIISLGEFAMHQLLFWCTVGASFIARHFYQLREREREAHRLALEKSELQSTLRQAELDVLRMRLNPHFLFNTLQNISVLMQQDPRTAGQMLTRLGDLLRAAFRRDAPPEIPLQDELALTEAYLEVEKMRFRDRLSITYDIARGTELALVPTFLLQPLVENAIKHGLNGKQVAGRIHIQSAREGNHLLVAVTDNGVGLPAKNLNYLEMGVGLGSTSERLARMYPQRHELTMRNLDEGGAEVRIQLPFRVNGSRDENIPAITADIQGKVHERSSLANR
jgi:two-component system, LytTR family, sensor kinase